MGNSLVQLHINDATGLNGCGEGLRIKMGEIPIVEILNITNSSGRVIQYNRDK
ncbi:MAG: hypothetical protein WAM42_19870 [Candidatus Nitrosopolaris sp.]